MRHPNFPEMYTAISEAISLPWTSDLLLPLLHQIVVCSGKLLFGGKELSFNERIIAERPIFFLLRNPLSGVFQLLSILKSRFDHSSTTTRTNILTLNTILLPSLGPFFRTLNSDETKSICGFLGRYQVKAFVKPIFYIIALPKIRWESKRLWKRPKRPLAVMWSRKRFFQCSQLWPLQNIGRKGV